MISASDALVRRLATGLLVLLVLFSRAAAAAEDAERDDARVAARQLASEGAEAFEHGDLERALDRFERAGALVTAPTIELMRARTLSRMERLVAAADAYAAAQRLPPDEQSNEAFLRAAEAAGKELDLLRLRIPTLRVKLGGPGAERASALLLDGKPLPPALVGVDDPVDPGPHRIEVTRRGRVVASRNVSVAERTHEEVVLEVPAEPAAGSATAFRHVAAPTSPERTRASMNVLGWALLGTGAALVTVGAVSGASALHHKSDLDAACRPGCPPDRADDISAFRWQRTLSYVAFGLGALGLGGGFYLVIEASPTPATTGSFGGKRLIGLIGSLP